MAAWIHARIHAWLPPHDINEVTVVHRFHGVVFPAERARGRNTSVAKQCLGLTRNMGVSEQSTWKLTTQAPLTSESDSSVLDHTSDMMWRTMYAGTVPGEMC